MKLKRYLPKRIENKTDAIDSKITSIDYNADFLSQKNITTLSEVTTLRDKPTVTWVDIQGGLDNDNLLKIISDNFKLHSLTFRDLKNRYHHPKIEEFSEYIFIVFKLLSYKDKKIDTKQISLIVSDTFVLSFQEIENDIFDGVISKLNESKGKIRETGTDYLVYELVNCLIEKYFFAMEQIVEEIENLEEKVMLNPKKEDCKEIHRLKREIILFRKQIWPTRELATVLARGDTVIVKEETKVFMRDIYDQTIQVLDTLESLRDVLSGVLDIYLSSISNRMNEIMKVLTIISTIFIPLTFFAGVYGMNFEYMPELHFKYSYPILWFVLILIVIIMIRLFKRKKWL